MLPSIRRLLWFWCCCTPILCWTLWTECIPPACQLLGELMGTRFCSSLYIYLGVNSLVLVVVFCRPFSWRRSWPRMVLCLLWSFPIASVLLWIFRFPWFRLEEVLAAFLLMISGHSVIIQSRGPILLSLAVVGTFVCWKPLHGGGTLLVLWLGLHLSPPRGGSN